MPVADVRFKGEIARWTHSGQALTAALSERSCKLAGTDLAPAKDVVLVRRSARDDEGEPGSELVGCVTPAGPQRVVGSAAPFGLGEASVSASVAGTWVLVSESSSNQYGADGSTGLVDLRSGRSYGVYGYRCELGSCGVPRLAAVRLNDRGQSATALELEGKTTLKAYTSTGDARALDSGASAELPASSLQLIGSTASWTRNGEARTFEIPEG